MIHGIEWIFFDLGTTLVDETEADYHRIRDMIAGTSITKEKYCRKRLEMIHQGLQGDLATIKFFGLTKTPWHNEDEKLYPDAEPILEKLKAMGYQLGIIANQAFGTKQRLENWGIDRYFDVIAASAELGISKPDEDIFRWALMQARCRAQNAIMIGDRLDNDIAPANRIGMHNVRILRGLGAYHNPQSLEESPEFTIQNLEELLSLLEKQFHNN